jgi:serine protease inhibitor
MFKKIFTESKEVDVINKISMAVEAAKKVVKNKKLDKIEDLVDELLYFYGEK